MAIADVARILYSCIEDESKALDEEKLEELKDVCNGIRKSGLYMYFSNEFFEIYAGILANNLELRKFILSLSDRFHLKLALNSDMNDKTPEEYVEFIMGQIKSVAIRQRTLARATGSCLLEEIQASMNLLDIDKVLTFNPHYLVFYMALATNALYEFFDTYEDDRNTRTT